MERQERTAQADSGRKFAIVFALIGALVIFYQLIGYVTWTIGPNFAAVSPGTDPIPPEVLATVRSTEQSQMVAAALWTIFLAGYSVWRRSLTWPLVLTIVWSATYWQEAMVNAGPHAFTLNLHFFNRGDWMSDLPLMPIHGPTMTQPLKMEVPAFYLLNPLFSVIAAGLMLGACRFLRIRNPVLLVLVGAIFGIVMDTYAELTGIKAGIMAWNLAYPPLSIAAGTTAQWRVYEGIMLGTLWSFLGILYFFRGQNRFSPWDDAMNFMASTRKREVAVVLMLVGIHNTVFMAYNLLVVWLSILSPQVRDLPSYLSGPAL